MDKFGAAEYVSQFIEQYGTGVKINFGRERRVDNLPGRADIP